jgi:ABC-type transport system involved in multi-copper enzyme maturation permease subunit
MSTVAAETVSLPRLVDHGRVTQWHVVRSEWRKLISLRSSRWSLGVFVLLTIGLSVLFAAVTSAHWGHMSVHDRADRHPLDIALAGVNLSQLAIGVLGVLVITGEYSTGMIRASLTAVPKRLPVLWAKLGVFAAVTFLLALPSVLIAFFATQAILSRHDILQISFSQHGVARAVVGGAVYLMLLGIFALALGAMLRNTAGGIAVFAAIFFVIPPLLDILPTSWNNTISPYLPNNAGRSIFSLTHGAHSLAWGPGLALFCGYCAVAIVIAAVLLVRRDA